MSAGTTSATLEFHKIRLAICVTVGTLALADTAIAQLPAARLIPAGARATTLSAQDDPFSGLEDGDAIAMPAATTTAATAEAATSAVPNEDQEKQDRLAKLKMLNFDRRPSAILAAWSRESAEAASAKKETSEATDEASEATEETSEATGETSEPTAEPSEPTEEEKQAAEKLAQYQKRQELFEETLKLLPQQVTLGRWEAFAGILKDRERLSEEEAIAVYERLMQELSKQQGLNFDQVVGLSDEMRQFLQSTMANQRNNPAQRFAEKNAVSFADLLAILKACPVELRDQDVRQIAGLLRSVLAAGSQLDDFVKALKKGGDELISRPQAALLLSSAGQDEYIAEFLPSFDEAVAAKNAQVLNLLARYRLASFAKEGKEEERELAWKATRSVLDLADVEDADRKEALARAIQLVPQLRDEYGKTWLQESFSDKPERGQEIMVAIGTAASQRLAQTPQDATSRQQYLQLQKGAIEALIATGQEFSPEMIGVLNLLANNWLQEANVAMQFSNRSQMGPSMRRDPFGNIYYVSDENEDPFGAQQQMRMGMINPVEVDQILQTAPAGKWFEVIDASLRPHYSMVLSRLWLKLNEDAKAFPYIEELAATHPEIALDLAEEFLRVWTRNHNPNDQQQRTNYYIYMYGYEQKAESIPLTRSKQERNIQELSEWVSRLEKLPLEGKIDESLLVRAFMTCHSVAEVFDLADIEQIFGKVDGIEPATIASLVQQMRSNLAGVWRDPNVQRDAQTKRRKPDIEAEVERGYEVANRVVDKALQQHPGQWQLLLAKASLMHDQNEYLNELESSSEFSGRRQEAFVVFAAAAQAYVEIAPTLIEREYRTDAFDYWFYSALGATDLRGLSEKNRAVPAQVDAIAEVMNSLTGELGQKHRDRFANALFTRMSAVNPACKFRYLENGFKLVGDNPQANEARKVYDYYKDLVTELELVARVDGETLVGHNEPFGVYVDLRHTKELERESGGFGKYLMNQNTMYYSYNYGRPTENYRDKFQEAATAALQETFEVLSVTFNHPETTSLPSSPSGWRVTPYAYLLLKARGPEVDKIPSMKIDLDFLDTSGYVVLPISSAPVAIDASKPTDGESSPTGQSPAKLDIVEVLDERQANEGKLIVEVKATARGLIPDFESLFDQSTSGFQLAEIEDSGVSVIEFDRQADLPTITSERTWTLQFASQDPNQEAEKSFAFPTPKLDVNEIRYQRYVDADLEDVEPVVSLVAQYGSNKRYWMTVGLIALASCMVLVGLIIFAFRSNRGAETAVDTPVAEVNPFTVLTRLRGMMNDGRLSAEQQSRLRGDIDQLERYYFAQTNGNAAPDLQAIHHRWA